MAKIIKFGEVEKKPQKIEKSAVNKGASMEVISNVLSKINSGLGLQIDISLRLLQIRAHLGGLKGHSSTNGVALRRMGLKNYTIEELHALAQKSTPEKWTTSPAYYRALIDEIRLRQKPE